MSASNVIRWAGLSAMVAGVLFVGTQIIRLPNDPSSVATRPWAIGHYLELGALIFILLGIIGLYARQVNEAGLLGLVGFLMLFVGLTLFTAYAFVEGFIMPVLATDAPQSIGGLLPGESLVGALIPILLLEALLYFIGGLLFGIATIRAGILPRWAATLFIVGVVMSGVGAVLPEVVSRIGAAAMGLGLAWLGYALWSERREEFSEPVPAMQS